MTAAAFESMSMSVAPLPGAHRTAMSRPQVGIERLPARRMSNEPRESMNCKSCRKRKIKCNRLRPSCEACQVFQCPCIYDAVPKKRGPKTDVLEALLKRVDGLEQKLKDQKKAEAASNSDAPTSSGTDDAGRLSESVEPGGAITAAPDSKSIRSGQDGSVASRPNEASGESAIYSPSASSQPSPGVQTDALLDTYFNRFHAKPYHILDESSVRQRLQLSQLPNYLEHAIYAVAARYTPHPNGYQAAVKLSEDYTTRAKNEFNADEPSVDALQAVLLLVIAFTAAGKGKKAYMWMTNAVGMAMALELHREVDLAARITPVEREMRRRLFWTCYLLDRYMSCGSKRPALISDKAVMLRLPCWSLNPAALPIEGEFFQSGSNLQYFQGNGKKSQGSNGMLIDISRILGITNQYLAAGGVKGDSHFPWHSLSNLSKIRQDLDIWASGTDDVFSSVDSLFGQNDSTVLVLSKLIYHLIHCLIYRPFIPIDLAELAGTGQHQSWQIEATNMCFLHANAIAELVELGKQTATIEWPALVGYCICTAGTVHIHGAYYNKSGASEMGAFASSAEFLSREMQQLSELRYSWASIQHQRETLQAIYNAHAELVKSLANNPMRYSPVFHLEDFFDRYANIGGPGGQTFTFDTANLSLSDVIMDFAADSYTGHDLYAPRNNGMVVEQGPRRNLKRKSTTAMERKRPDLKGSSPMRNGSRPIPTRHQSFAGSQTSSGMLANPSSMSLQSDMNGASQPLNTIEEAGPGATASGFSPPPPVQQLPALSATPFSPPYDFAALSGTAGNSNTDNIGFGGYDPMFGTLPTNAFSSPAAWHGEPEDRKPPIAPSPGAGSQHGSAGTGSGEEKDPFLSLLEQLAENENAQGPGSDFDFFLTSAQA